jgi:hypothetical protein
LIFPGEQNFDREVQIMQSSPEGNSGENVHGTRQWMLKACLVAVVVAIAIVVGEKCVRRYTLWQLLDKRDRVLHDDWITRQRVGMVIPELIRMHRELSPGSKQAISDGRVNIHEFNDRIGAWLALEAIWKLTRDQRIREYAKVHLASDNALPDEEFEW